MVDSRAKLREYIQYERMIYLSGKIGLPFEIRERDILFKMTKLLRCAEYHFNTGHRLRYCIYKIRLNRIQNKYAIHIPINTVDKGLSIAHVGPIIINGKCKLGENLRVNVGVNIGSNGGEPPQLGNDIYIGPGAKIFGNICIADGVKVGANAVVNKSCLVENALLVGVPANIVR